MSWTTPHVSPVGHLHDSCHVEHSPAAGDIPAADYSASPWCSECRHYHPEAAPCVLPLGGFRLVR